MVDVKAVAHLFSVPRPQRRVSVGPGLLDEQGANGVIGTGCSQRTLADTDRFRADRSPSPPALNGTTTVIGVAG
ncbi:hypothetical protein D5045_00475 [Verminephrobacter eiseniae]|nr:hypothetical protein [Verminephrobacter eiseniae]